MGNDWGKCGKQILYVENVPMQLALPLVTKSELKFINQSLKFVTAVYGKTKLVLLEKALILPCVISLKNKFLPLEHVSFREQMKVLN